MTYVTTYYRGNVASFQLLIYEGPRAGLAQQGDVEFRYNNVTGPTKAQLDLVDRGVIDTSQIRQNPANN